MAAILTYQHPKVTAAENQPTKKVELWYYGAADGTPSAIGTVDGSYRLVGRTSTPAPNGVGVMWELTWSTAAGGTGGNPAATQPNNDPVYTMDDSGVEIPLAQLPNYRTCWDHDLLCRFVDGDVAPSLPAWWATAIDTVVEEDPDVYYWSRSDFPSIEYDPEGRKWITLRLAARTKPGIESRVAPAMTVTETRYFEDETAAGLDVATVVGTLKAPAELFGGPVRDEYWLVQSARVYPDGERWVAQKIYAAAGYIGGQWQKWDADIYGAVGS